MNNRAIYIIIAIVVALLSIGGGWYYFSLPAAPTTNTDPNNVLGTAPNNQNSIAGTPEPSSSDTIESTGQTASTKIFQITSGPVVGATFIQTLRPTTTLARYIKQEDGHVYDLPLDVPGAVPRVVSNVTIPGGQRALWAEGGNAAVMQYVDSGVVKTAYLGLPTVAATTTILPTRISFLPDAIVDIAISPDGKNVAYLLKTAAGADGYTAKADGTGAKKLFSVPLSQLLISWPSQAFLLVQTKPATGVMGVVFSVDTKNGTVVPLVHAQGIRAVANSDFSTVLYQTSESAGMPRTYSYNVKGGTAVFLKYSPLPEKCIINAANKRVFICAIPADTVPQNYIDLWNLGTASIRDAILAIDSQTGNMLPLGLPGEAGEGGVASDIFGLSLSPGEKYLSYITKGSRSLWGVRLTQ